MKLPAARSLVIGAIIVAVLAGLAWVVTSQGPLARVKVTVTEATARTLSPSIFGIGTVDARRSYGIGPTAAGRLARVLVDQGAKVVAGQLLAEMDPVDLDERLVAGKAGAQRAEHSARAAQFALDEAQSRARVALSNADRYAELRRTNFVSQEAADAKRHEANAAQAARDAAEAALAAARDETRRVQADLAGTALSRAHLRLASPVNGVVVARLAEPGSTVVAGQVVVQVIDPASLWVRARIDQGRSAGLAVGLPADVVLRSRPGQPLAGRVERVDLVGDSVTEERLAHVAFEQMPAEATIGDLAEVTLRLPAIEGALAIPTAALKRTGTTRGVWMVNEGRAKFRPIGIGAETLDGFVHVVSGLKAGEAVIVHSGRPLAEGDRVTVTGSLVRGGS
ncbi:MAG TPA: efflux RND transporter periplasmic adaptor subunit [Usitatibacteraceae bacterium]|nr:efflux RND transporter periplasmic adaptor subunit [Usitatibacteraceae bacterium]